MNFITGIIKEAAGAVGLDDEIEKVSNTVEEKTGINLENTIDGVMSGGLVGGVTALISQQQEHLNDKYGGVKRISISNKIYLTKKEEDAFNLSCDLINVKESDNILLNTIYLLFFNNDTSSQSYKIRLEICKILQELRWLFGSYFGFIVSPSYALANSSKGLQSFLYNLNDFTEEIINQKIINETFISFIRSDLIAGFISGFYPPIVLLLILLFSKNSYNKTIKKLIT